MVLEKLLHTNPSFSLYTHYLLGNLLLLRNLDLKVTYCFILMSLHCAIVALSFYPPMMPTVSSYRKKEAMGWAQGLLRFCPNSVFIYFLFSSEQVTFPNSLPVVWPVKQRLSLPASLSAAGCPENMSLWKCFVKGAMLRGSTTTPLGRCRDRAPPSWSVLWAHVDGDLTAGGGLFPLQLAPLNPAT